MGSSPSRLKSRPSRPKANRSKPSLSALICGGSSSRTPVEMEDPAETLVSSAEHCDPLYDELHSHIKESFSFSSSGTGFTSFKPEAGASSESSVTASEGTDVENSSKYVGAVPEKHLHKNRELVPIHHQDTAGTPSKEQCSPEPASANVWSGINSVNDNDTSVNVPEGCIFPEVIHSSSLSPSELGEPWLGGAADENHVNEVVTIQTSDSNTIPIVSDLSVAFQLQRDEPMQGAIHSGLGFLVSDREQEQSDGIVLNDGLVSISSNFLSSSANDIRNLEARRNSRRLFWDAFSRRRYRRRHDSPTSFFPMDDSDDLGTHDRWLLDISGDFNGDSVGSDSGHLNTRTHRTHSMSEQQPRSRSEIWERLRGGITETGQHTTFCPSGLHPDGTCSCETFSTAEESGTRASISRIVMLAEALFEVLDEIHRQPVSFSLSMSLPAPASLVDSFPLKSHRKPGKIMAGDDVEQCYICLADYEDGDKIRVLPCRHEYHMSCVDKWLKEIHGVCPLCRGDVREGKLSEAVSNSTSRL